MRSKKRRKRAASIETRPALPRCLETTAHLFYQSSFQAVRDKGEGKSLAGREVFGSVETRGGGGGGEIIQGGGRRRGVDPSSPGYSAKGRISLTVPQRVPLIG